MEDSYQLSCLTITRTDERKGTHEYLILHWKEKLRVNESAIHDTDKGLDSMKTTMLESTSAPLPHLKYVKDMTEKLNTRSRDILHYNYMQHHGYSYS